MPGGGCHLVLAPLHADSKLNFRRELNWLRKESGQKNVCAHDLRRESD
jgi:hypothetical protein